MDKIFISYSTKDFRLVKFLIHILNFYRIKTWCAPFNVPKGKQFKFEIHEALSKCTKMLVIVTRNALESTWITYEITKFQSINEHNDIIPCIYEMVDLNKIVPDLADYEYIDFTDLKEGFTELFKKLGLNFLPQDNTTVTQDTEVASNNSNIPNNPERRQISDRRVNGERRSKDITNRLHTSIWTYYSRGRQLSKGSIIKINVQEFFRLIRATKPVAKKYICYDDSRNIYNFEQVMNTTAFSIWTSLEESYEKNYIQAQDLCYKIANRLMCKYVINYKDRRVVRDRREH